MKTSGWVLYDAGCLWCATLAKRSRALLARRRFVLVPLQTPWIASRLGLPPEQLLTEMRLLLPDGRVFGGADALLELSRRFWWAWPFYALGRVPVLRKMLHAGYAWVARHRSCIDGTCDVVSQDQTAVPHRRVRTIGFLPLLAFPAL